MMRAIVHPFNAGIEAVSFCQFKLQVISMNKKRNINKVVLAYSGGLDTSIILKWLEDGPMTVRL